jgi:hypothetical protein
MGPKANKKAKEKKKGKKGKRAHSGLDQKEMNTTGTKYYGVDAKGKRKLALGRVRADRGPPFSR